MKNLDHRFSQNDRGGVKINLPKLIKVLFYISLCIPPFYNLLKYNTKVKNIKVKKSNGLFFSRSLFIYINISVKNKKPFTIMIKSEQIHRCNIFRIARLNGYAITNKQTYNTIDAPLIENKIFPGYCNWLLKMKLDKYSNKWNCINFSKAFSLFSDIYHTYNTENHADSIAIGIITYKSQSRAEDGSVGFHAINVGLDLQNNKLIPIFIEPQHAKIINLKKEELTTINTFYM